MEFTIDDRVSVVGQPQSQYLGQIGTVAFVNRWDSHPYRVWFPGKGIDYFKESELQKEGQ